MLFISKLDCSLAGKTQRVLLVPGSKTHRAYNRDTAIELFRCNYGLNDEFRNRFEDADLKIAGVDDENKVRVMEIPDHRFLS